MKLIKVQKTLVDNIELGDGLDMEFNESFGADYDKEYWDEVEVRVVSNDNYVADASPIEIDRVIKHLQEVKEKGATHVEMEYHVDHKSYMISAYECEKYDEEEQPD